MNHFKILISKNMKYFLTKVQVFHLTKSLVYRLILDFIFQNETHVNLNDKILYLRLNLLIFLQSIFV
jgi:hypothetical protein